MYCVLCECMYTCMDFQQSQSQKSPSGIGISVVVVAGDVVVAVIASTAVSSVPPVTKFIRII